MTSTTIHGTTIAGGDSRKQQQQQQHSRANNSTTTTTATAAIAIDTDSPNALASLTSRTPQGSNQQRRQRHKSVKSGSLYHSQLDNSSLAQILSSPERYAQVLGLTVAQVQECVAARQAAVAELIEKVEACPDGATRHRLVCQHRFDQGKHPFVCPQCFSYLPICCCPYLASQFGTQNHTKKQIPVRHVVLWTHHEEWGSSSNTGSILPLMLQNTHLLMKGLHEDQLEILLHPDDGTVVQPVVLWPEASGVAPRTKHQPAASQQDSDGDDDSSNGDVNGSDAEPRKRSLRWDNSTIDQLPSFDHIVLIAVEGTWRQARRMVGKLPYPRLAVKSPPTTPPSAPQADDFAVPPKNSTSMLLSSSSSSIVAAEEKPVASSSAYNDSWIEPLRKRSRGRDLSTVCTAQAVLWALEHTFGMEHDPALERAVQTKIELTRRYQGKPYRGPAQKNTSF
ncbi:hypothetical protein ACA910_010345 [Epithemia clementina (nom. ined.)]